MDPTPENLRNRAWRMRAVASRLEAAPILSLDASAGADTWQCPAADEYLLQLSQFQHRVLQAADDLRWHALVLEQRAADHEAAAALAAVVNAV